MKLANHTLVYVSGSLLVIIGVWAVIFYFSMLDEVYDSIDDGLGNYKLLIIQKARQDSLILNKTEFDESNYRVKKIPQEFALEIKEQYRDTLMYMQSEEDYEPIRILSTVFSSGGNYYKLDIVSSMVEEDDLIEDLSYALIWLYLIIVLSIVLINNLMLKKIWAPFYALIAQLRQFRLGQNNSFVPAATKVTEFKNLDEAVQRLLKSNIETYNAQKQFIENASHELQTPLAISINKLELLAEESTFTENQIKTISEVLEALERLTRLNKSLLLISKIENRQYAQEQPLVLNSIIKQEAENLKDFLEFRNISLTLKEEGEFELPFNKDLAGMLIGNLLKNAIIHNIENGTLQIEINPHTIRFSNTGNAGSLDPVKIFQRFYKDDSKKSSTGLGLAIVKTIADHYNLVLEYSFDGKHHFSLKK